MAKQTQETDVGDTPFEGSVDGAYFRRDVTMATRSLWRFEATRQHIEESAERVLETVDDVPSTVKRAENMHREIHCLLAGDVPHSEGVRSPDDFVRAAQAHLDETPNDAKLAYQVADGLEGLAYEMAWCIVGPLETIDAEEHAVVEHAFALAGTAHALRASLESFIFHHPGVKRSE